MKKEFQPVVWHNPPSDDAQDKQEAPSIPVGSYGEGEDSHKGCIVGWLDRLIDTPADQPTGQLLRRVCANRWLRTVAYGIVTMCCCAIYFGWQQFQKILFRGGAYEWLCRENDPNWVYDETIGPCDPQNAQVKMLYTVATAMEFVAGVVAGVVLDHTGPRVCGLTGLVVLLSGVLLLMGSSQSVPLYIPSMILLGVSTNLVAFPALLAGDFFPRNQALVISFILACQIFCSTVAIILLAVWRAYSSLSFHHLFAGYLVFVWLPCCILYFFFLPCKRRVPEPVNTCLSDQTAGSTIAADVLPTDQTDAEAEMTRLGSASSSSRGGVSPCSMECEPTGECLYKRRTNGHKSSELQSEQLLTVKKTILMKGDWKDFFKDILTWEVQLFTVYYVLQLLQFIYYPTTTLRMFGVWMSDFAGYITPTQFVWGIFFGWLVDKIGTLSLCYVMNTLNILTFAFMLINNYTLQYATVMVNCISQSFIYTSKFTYVAETYSPSNFGKLAGYIGFCGGIFAFLNIPIGASSDYRFWSITFLIVSGVCYIFITILMIRQRLGVNYIRPTSVNKATEPIEYSIVITSDILHPENDKAE